MYEKYKSTLTPHKLTALYRIGPFFRGKQFSQILRILGPFLKIKTANCMVGVVNGHMQAHL